LAQFVKVLGNIKKAHGSASAGSQHQSIDLRTKITMQLNSLEVKASREMNITMTHPVLAYNEQDATSVSIPRRTPGSAKGLIQMSPDFDEPLDDFQAYMS